MTEQNKSPSGEPPDLRSQLESANKAAEYYRDRLLQQGPTFNLLEVAGTGLIEQMSSAENRELGKDYEDAMSTLNADVVYLVKDSRTHFVPQTWPLLGLQKQVDSLRVALRNKAKRAPKIADLPTDVSEGVKDEATRLFETDKAYRSRLNFDFNTIYSYTMMAEDAAGKMGFYFEGKGMYGILDTGRRISVMSTDDYRMIQGRARDTSLKDEALEKLPKEMREGVGEKLVKNFSHILHYDMALAYMNQYDPSAENGKEMAMRVTTAEQEFLGPLFQKSEFNLSNSSDEDIANLKVVGEGNKEFYVDALSYYCNVNNEKQHKKYISLLTSVAMLDVHSRLENFSSDYEQIKKDGKLEEFKKLRIQVYEKAKEIMNNWDSPEITIDQEIAMAAVEHSFMFNVATLNIGDLGHSYKWTTERNKDKYHDDRVHAISYIDEVGDPDMALDAVNAKYAILHEMTYRHKNRISTSLIPPTDRKFIERWINYSTKGGKDIKLPEKLVSNPSLARGAGLIGLFEKIYFDKDGKKLPKTRDVKGEIVKPKDADDTKTIDLSNNRDWKDGQTMRKDLRLECNQDFLVFLEDNMWGLPTAYGVDFPMPILPFIDSTNLLATMKVKEKNEDGSIRTVKDILNDGKLITDAEIDLEDQHPFAGDGSLAADKFIMNYTKLLWGRVDDKTLDGMFASPYAAITDMIKWSDIGKRYQKENKKFYEISETCYMANAYMAFYKSNLWGGNGAYQSNREKYISHTNFPGVVDFVEAESYLADNKQGVFPHYKDSFMLLQMALAEFSMAVGVNTDAGYGPYEKMRKQVSAFLKK